jgi:hypothetical protein
MESALVLPLAKHFVVEAASTHKPTATIVDNVTTPVRMDVSVLSAFVSKFLFYKVRIEEQCVFFFSPFVFCVC